MLIHFIYYTYGTEGNKKKFYSDECSKMLIVDGLSQVE